MTTIIGSGAAGLLAALAAVRLGKPVEVYEKMAHPGIKLGLAGGGRCNLSNTGDLLAGLHNTGFLRPALAELSCPELRRILAETGVDSTADETGRVYPKDINGRELAAHLHTWLGKKGVSFHFRSPLTGIRVEDGALTALEIQGKPVPCSRAVLASGGYTWPQTGSDGSVQGMLGQLGHSIAPLLPALTPLKTRESWPTQLKGISLTSVEAAITRNGKTTDRTRGSLLFTHFGLSGPAVLDISHAAAKALHDSQTTHIVLDFLPELDASEIRTRLEEQRQKTTANALGALLPEQLAKTLGSEKYIKSLAPSTLDQLARALKETRLEIIDTLGKTHAMVSQGGVSLREMNPRTMESRLIRGLYIAGEILDYHGITGGYNLHAAFATGWLAGTNA